MFVIPKSNQLSYRSIPRNKDLNLTINNHCDLPSRVLVVDSVGNCFVCACEAWLPITVGHIMDFARLDDVWASPVARALQKDIDEKKFTHCAVDRCGVLNNNQTAAEFTGRNSDCYYISINIDDSCNLACPSCRKGIVMSTGGVEFDQRSVWVNHLVDLLGAFEQPVHIIMSGNGDPLASNIMRPLLHSWKPRANETIRLFTNGLLLEKQLTDNPIVNNITQYFISVDAGSSAVYEQVRRPGKFNILRKNFDFLRSLVDRTKALVLLKFVLQAGNFNDMQNFVNLCIEYNFAGDITRLEDWDTWDSFSSQDVVGNKLHADHLQTMINLKDIHTRYNQRIQFNPSLITLCKTL